MTIVLITTKHTPEILFPTIIPELFLKASDSHRSFLEALASDADPAQNTM